MSPKPGQDAPDHLRERLSEAQDVANFSRGARSGAPAPQGQPIERVTELSGDGALGGRRIRDRFMRSGEEAKASSPPAPKLEPYLEARLKEVQDGAPRFQSAEPNLGAEAVDTYRALRRQLGGE